MNSPSPNESQRLSHIDESSDALVSALPPVRHRNRAFGSIVAFSVVLLAALGLASWTNRNPAKPPQEGPFFAEPVKTPAATAKATQVQQRAALPSSGQILVHVAGRVKKPGVYGLPAHSRVWDAVKKAGGALSDGDVNAINLAAWVEDGSRIEVPPREAEPLVEPRTAEVQPNFESSPRRASVRQSTTTRTANRESTRVRKRAGSTRTRKAAALETLAKNPLDLNRADVAQLETLPGIGPAMAGRILEYRAENGGFKSVDDLDDVKGIGEAKMEKLRPLVMVR